MLASSELIDLTAAAKLLPHRPHPATLWRWCRKGVKARSGVRIRLEHVRLGGKIYTTAAALDRLGSALADADAEHFVEVGISQSVPTIDRSRGGADTSTPTQREREIVAAEKQLENAGV